MGIGIKIVSVLMLAAVLSLFVVFLVFRAPWYGAVLSGILSLILAFGTYLLMFNRITIDYGKRTIKIHKIKATKFKFEEIKAIRLDTEFSTDPKKYCFIIFAILDKSEFKVAGYAKLFNRNSIQITKQIADVLNDAIKKENIKS